MIIKNTNYGFNESILIREFVAEINNYVRTNPDSEIRTYRGQKVKYQCYFRTIV
jgi:hypothetical protein